MVFGQVYSSGVCVCVIALVGCRLVRFEAEEKGRKDEDGFKMAPFSSLTYKWDPAVEKSVL